MHVWRVLLKCSCRCYYDMPCLKMWFGLLWIRPKHAVWIMLYQPVYYFCSERLVAVGEEECEEEHHLQGAEVGAPNIGISSKAMSISNSISDIFEKFAKLAHYNINKKPTITSGLCMPARLLIFCPECLMEASSVED